MRDVNMLEIPVVHAVTTDHVLLRDDFPARALGVMLALGERGAIHVRSRLMDSARLYRIACRLVGLHADTGCWCIINDRVDIALAAGAHGVQLNSRSMAVTEARGLAGRMRVGASVHTPDEAASAESEGADWCVAGHVYETETHPAEPARDVAFIAGIVAGAGLPVIAIGGIRPEHVRLLIRSGAYGVAAIRGIWDAKNSDDAASRYLSEYDRHSETSGPRGVAIGR